MWIGSLRLSFGRPIGGPFPINERPNNRREKTNNLESSRSTTAMATVVSTIETTRSFSLCEWMSQIALGLKMFTPFTAQIGSTATIATATAPRLTMTHPTTRPKKEEDANPMSIVQKSRLITNTGAPSTFRFTISQFTIKPPPPSLSIDRPAKRPPQRYKMTLAQVWDFLKF